MNKGTIIKNISNQYVVRFEDGQEKTCVAMGKLRQGLKPLVGDYVLVEQFEHQYGIQKIEERKNFLTRPPIANVDQAVIVMSAKDPDFSTTLVDQLIFLISLANIEPVLCVSKMDLIEDDDALHEVIKDYQNSGYRVYFSGKNIGKAELFDCFNEKISVLTGQSGAGKSTILNELNPDFELQTQAISKALGRGKHTTRHSQLFPIGNGWVGDTPGFSKLDFSQVNPLELAHKLMDFNNLTEECRFRDCVHVDEPDCVIKMAVENQLVSKIRYQHYIEIVDSIRKKKR